MAKILIVAEHDGSKLNPSTAKCVACASEVDGAEIDVVILASDAAAVASQAARYQGVDKVLTVERPENEHPLATVLAPQVAALAAEYSYVLGPSTTFGKDLIPRVAALLEVDQVSDIMAVAGPGEFRRPVYAGNAIVSVTAPRDQTVVGTVRTASYQAAATGNSAPVSSVTVDAAIPSYSRYIGLHAGESDRPDLQTASRVVSGGRALGSEENFELIYEFADSIGAAVGASRAAVDAGYVPNEHQVGQTGKIIAPDVYFAIGISGAIQHVTGIKDAGTIVAINTDADAPIFEVADKGLVADLFEAVPELRQALETQADA